MNFLIMLLVFIIILIISTISSKETIRKDNNGDPEYIYKVFKFKFKFCTLDTINRNKHIHIRDTECGYYILKSKSLEFVIGYLGNHEFLYKDLINKEKNDLSKILNDKVFYMNAEINTEI